MEEAKTASSIDTFPPFNSSSVADTVTVTQVDAGDVPDAVDFNANVNFSYIPEDRQQVEREEKMGFEGIKGIYWCVCLESNEWGYIYNNGR